MSKKIIFISSYLKKKKAQMNRKTENDKVESSSDKPMPIGHVVDMQAYLESKQAKSSSTNHHVEPEGSLSDSEIPETKDNVIAFKQPKKVSPASEDEGVAAQGGNVIFMQDYFKQKKLQRAFQKEALANTETAPFSLASYGMAAVFLFMFGTSVMLFQSGKNTNLAVNKDQKKSGAVLARSLATKPSAARSLASFKSEEIIAGRKPTSIEKNRGY